MKEKQDSHEKLTHTKIEKVEKDVSEIINIIVKVKDEKDE